MSIWLWITALAAGGLGGLIDATAGLGFGAFSSTVLVAAGIAPANVVATVSVAKIGSGVASGVSHWRLGNVERRWVLPLAAPGVVAGVAGGWLLTTVPDDVARVWMPLLLLALGLVILARFLTAAGDRLVAPSGGAVCVAADEPRRLRAWSRVARRAPGVSRMSAVGLVAGFVSSLSGTYGPFATSALLVLKPGTRPRYVVGTVSFVEAMVAAAVAVTILTRIDMGSFGWGLPIALMAGAAVTSPIGALLAKRLPARVMGVAVGAVLVVVNVVAVAV